MTHFSKITVSQQRYAFNFFAMALSNFSSCLQHLTEIKPVGFATKCMQTNDHTCHLISQCTVENTCRPCYICYAENNNTILSVANKDCPNAYLFCTTILSHTDSQNQLSWWGWPTMSFKVTNTVTGAIRYSTYDFLLVFHWNYVSILYHSRDINTYLPNI